MNINRNFCVILFGLSAVLNYFYIDSPIYSQTTTPTNNNQNAILFEPTDSIYNTSYADTPVPSGITSTIVSSPNTYSSDAYYNSPWNFTPVELLFHKSKTINDSSAFSSCRLVNTTTRIRDSFKDVFLGVFDEKEYISTGVGKMPLFSKNENKINQVIVCSIQTEIPPQCVNYLGTGYVYMEDYVSTEAALLGVAQLASKKGANLVGNMRCLYQQNAQSFSTALGATTGALDMKKGDANSNTAGLGWGSSRAKKPVQPHCSGDFYIATPCEGGDSNYYPKPRAYRRYLPSETKNQASNKNGSVRGYW